MLNLHVYPSPLTHESRILRLTDVIADMGIFTDIDVVGIAAEGLPAEEHVDARWRFVRLPQRLGAGRNGLLAKVLKSTEWSLRVLRRYRREPVGCVSAHSLAVLPLCVALAAITGAKLVYDTHELETETSGYRGLRQKLGKLVERMLIGRADHVFVVSDSIGEWYAREYGIRTPTTIRNIPQFEASKNGTIPPEMASLPIPGNSIRFIYQGGFIAGRGIERLLETFAASPRMHLILMGSGPLTPLVRKAAQEHANVHLLPPVPPSQVLNYTRGADIGICLTDNSCLSHYYSLPNKVFEYLHAGLPVIVNPLFEQEKLVSAHRCGWVAPEKIEEIRVLLERIDRPTLDAARAGAAAARSVLTWENERVALQNAYRELYS